MSSPKYCDLELTMFSPHTLHSSLFTTPTRVRRTCKAEFPVSTLISMLRLSYFTWSLTHWKTLGYSSFRISNHSILTRNPYNAYCSMPGIMLISFLHSSIPNCFRLSVKIFKSVSLSIPNDYQSRSYIPKSHVPPLEKPYYNPVTRGKVSRPSQRS